MGIFRQRRPVPHLVVLLCSLLICSLLLAAMPAAVAFAGDCDGTAGPDTVTCSADPAVPDGEVGLDLGDDNYVQNEGATSVYVGGDAQDDGSLNTGNGGNDHITINGTVIMCVDGDFVDGEGGNDTIIINGEVQCEVTGDYATGNGGDDQITVNGEVGSDVKGDSADNNGGNDTIIINGSVGGDVIGDYVDNDGGDDIIVINGSVGGDVLADDALGAGGDDTVTLGYGAGVGGVIDGEGGYDLLKFEFLKQSHLAGLDPAGGTLTISGITFTWQNFEQLIGLLRATGLRILFERGSILAIAAEEGIVVFAEPRRIAFISYSSLGSLAVGASFTYATPNAAGWYVTITNLGANPNNSSHDLFQVTIFAPAGSQQGYFTFSN